MNGLHKNFKYALIGIKKAFLEGPIIKIITMFGAIAITSALLLHFPVWKMLIIIFGWIIGISFEMMNSALESVVDATKIYNQKTEDAKDMGSGSVLFYAIGSVIVGILLFIA